MELVVAQVVAVLSKYAIDKGESLLREAGKAAADAARELFDTVVGALRNDPATTTIADGFEKKPEGYAEPVKDVLQDRLAADPALEARVRELMEQLQAATPAATYSIIVSGSGAAAVNRSQAVGEGGNLAGQGGVIVTGGSMSGSVGGATGKRPP